MTFDNPLMIAAMRYLAPLWEGEDGTGGGENTGGGQKAAEGGDATEGGKGEADVKTGDTPEAVLNGGTGKTEDNTEKDDDASDEQSDGEAAEADADNEVPGEGEGYEFTLPEGVEIDEKMAETLSPLLKEVGIGKADANKLAGALAGFMAEQAKANVEAYVDRVNTWTKDAKADKELGADWDATVQIANKGLTTFGTPELTAALAETGMSNHPEMIRFMYRIAKHTGNDTLDRGKDVDTSEVPAEASWYGKTTPATKQG